MNQTEATRSVCSRWWDLWTSHADLDQKRVVLSETLEFRFNAGVVVHGRDSFLTGESWPTTIEVEMLAEVVEGSRASHFYEVRNGDARLRVAELFTVEDGLISAIDFITDLAAYPGLLDGHERAAT